MNRLDDCRKISANAALRQELCEWKQANRCPRLFLRDDDAIDTTSALSHLYQIIEHKNIPILLAVIPKFATNGLREFVYTRPLIRPAIHGFAHMNHAGIDEKKSELGDHRPTNHVISELLSGIRKLRIMFGDRLSNLLVPPWNRIGTNLAMQAKETGLGGISAFGWKKPQAILPWVNTHVDIINWKCNKISKSINEVMSELVLNLQTARQNDFAPVGILTHHRMHDEQCWIMLGKLFDFLEENGPVDWVAADDLITECTIQKEGIHTKTRAD